MPRRLAAAALVAAAVLALPAATAVGRPAAHAAGAHTVRLATVPGRFAFAPTRLSTSAGKVTLRLRNVSSLSHGIGLGSRTGPIVGPGGTSSVTVRLKRGTYTYFCPLHRALGMKGTLTVR